MKKVAARLKVSQLLSQALPKPENTPFSAGDMIDVIIGMIPNAWCKTMAQTGTEPRETEFDKIITHLEILDEKAPEQKDSEGNQEVKRAQSQNNKIRGNKRSKHGSTSNAKPGNNSSHNGKSCNFCKLFKGTHSSAWKTYNTKYYKSQTTLKVR